MLLRSGRLAEEQTRRERAALVDDITQTNRTLTAFTIAETQPRKAPAARQAARLRKLTEKDAAAAGAGTVAALSTAAAAACSSASSAGSISLPLRLPLALMPPAEVPSSRVVDTDIGPLHLQRVHADPLIVRVPSFLTANEIAALIDAVDDSQPKSGSSAAAASADSAAFPVKWERYMPFNNALGRDAISDIATMSKCELRGMPSLYALLDTIAARIARVCQANVAHVSSLKEVLRYEPGQVFMLHKVRAPLGSGRPPSASFPFAALCPSGVSHSSILAACLLSVSLVQDDKEDTSTHIRGWRLMTALIYLQLEHPKEKGL